jgi:hypothetical protein
MRAGIPLLRVLPTNTLMFSRRPSSSGMCFAKTNSQKLSLGHSTTSISPLEMRSLLAEVIEGAKAR